MKKVFVISLVVLLVGVVSVVSLLGYAGFYHPVEVREARSGAYTLVYKKLKGDFSRSGAAITEVTGWLAENGIETSRGFGLYMDDPSKTPKDEVRFIAGAMLEAGDRDRIPDIRKKYRVREFGDVDAIVSEFPFRNRLNIIAGVVKVYPVLVAYGRGKGYPEKCIMEIYEGENERIRYIRPIDEKFDGPALYYR